MFPPTLLFPFHKIKNKFREFLRLGANTVSYFSSGFSIPPGTTPDASAMYGYFANVANLDLIDWDMQALAIGTNTAVALTGLQFVNNYLDISGNPGAGVTLTLPSTTQIIAATPSYTYPNQQQVTFPLKILNDGTGQTITLAAADANTTIVGNNTIANNTVREVMVAVNPTTGKVVVVNCGTKNL